MSLLSSAVKHDWEKMTESVQNHIGSLNWGYRVALREKKVVYENAYGKFIGPHRIKVIVKLHSVFFPGFFKTVFIGVSRKKNHISNMCFKEIKVSKARPARPRLSRPVTLLSQFRPFCGVGGASRSWAFPGFTAQPLVPLTVTMSED